MLSQKKPSDMTERAGDVVLHERGDQNGAFARQHDPRGGDTVQNIERFAFYDAARTAYAIVATGESALYANVMLQKGVVVD